MEILKIENIFKSFSKQKGLFSGVETVKAVDDVSFSIEEGETLGLVGESGCGKSTLGRIILRLLDEDSGKVYFKGEEITGRSFNELKPLRRDMQVIFQDPFAALNPRIKAGRAVAETLELLGDQESDEKARKMLELVGLTGDAYSKYPHEFSGGQRQRICIARALISKPKFVVCDEPVSSLDVSVQAQVINLLKDLKDEFKLTYLFISHDLRVVRNISDRVAVMKSGRLVEIGESDKIYESPKDDYTKELLAAVPDVI